MYQHIHLNWHTHIWTSAVNVVIITIMSKVALNNSKRYTGMLIHQRAHTGCSGITIRIVAAKITARKYNPRTL